MTPAAEAVHHFFSGALFYWRSSARLTQNVLFFFASIKLNKHSGEQDPRSRYIRNNHFTKEKKNVIFRRFWVKEPQKKKKSDEKNYLCLLMRAF